MNTIGDIGCAKVIGILAGLATIVGAIIAIFAWTMPFSPIGSSPIIRHPAEQSTIIPTHLPESISTNNSGQAPFATKLPTATLIPLPSNTNTSISIPPKTNTVAPKASGDLKVGQVWQFGDLEFKLEKVEINPNDVNTKFYVTNRSTKPFAFDPRFDQGYFQLSDNEGNSWNATDGAREVVVLNSGQTSGDVGPRFDGKRLTNPKVTRLTLRVKPSADSPEVRWSFEVNLRPNNPVLSDTPSQTVLDVGMPWNYGDIVYRLDRVELGTNDVNTKFYVTNKTDSVFVFETGAQLGYFTLTDSKGKTYRALDVPEGRYAVNPDATSGDIGPRFDAGFTKDPQIRYVLLTVNGLLGVKNATWRIEIAR